MGNSFQKAALADQATGNIKTIQHASKPEEEGKGDGKKDNLKYGWEEKNYGGAYKQKVPLQRNLSSIPDEMEIWRKNGRSMRLMEMFFEAQEALDKRPEQTAPRYPKGMDLNASVEQACHRQKIELYDAYARCMDKKKGDQAACNGWYSTYLSAWETCTTDLSLKVLETMAKEDPDPNMERLRR